MILKFFFKKKEEKWSYGHERYKNNPEIEKEKFLKETFLKVLKVYYHFHILSPIIYLFDIYNKLFYKQRNFLSLIFVE